MADASETPAECPTCATAIPPGAQRCPGCGRVFGEGNRCPHCHAVAGVIQRGQRTVCAACGKPRAGTVILGRGRPSPDRSATRAMLQRARGRGLRAFGVLAVALGVVLAALAATVVPGAAGLVIAAVLALLAVGVGALSIRSGARSAAQAEREEQKALEKRILRLAAEEGGRLTVSRAAEALGLGIEEADRALTQMVGDGSRVEVDVDDDGVLEFVFRELSRAPVKVRVDAEPGGEVPDDRGAEVVAQSDGDEESAHRRAD